MTPNPYTIVRSLRGSWPQWYLTADDGRTVHVYVRYGEGVVGVGESEDDAQNNSKIIKRSADYHGVTDVVDALVLLRTAGYYYVCSNGEVTPTGNLETTRPTLVDVDWPRQAGFAGAKFRGKVLEAIWHHTLGRLYSVQVVTPIPGISITRLWVEAKYCKEVSP